MKIKNLSKKSNIKITKLLTKRKNQHQVGGIFGFLKKKQQPLQQTKPSQKELNDNHKILFDKLLKIKNNILEEQSELIDLVSVIKRINYTIKTDTNELKIKKIKSEEIDLYNKILEKSGKLKSLIFEADKLEKMIDINPPSIELDSLMQDVYTKINQYDDKIKNNDIKLGIIGNPEYKYNPNANNNKQVTEMLEINRAFNRVYKKRFIKGVLNNVRQNNNVEKKTLREFSEIKKKYKYYLDNLQNFKLNLKELEKYSSQLDDIYRSKNNISIYSFNKDELMQIIDIMELINKLGALLEEFYRKGYQYKISDEMNKKNSQYNISGVSLKTIFEDIKTDLNDVSKMLGIKFNASNVDITMLNKMNKTQLNGKIKTNTYEPFNFILHIKFIYDNHNYMSNPLINMNLFSNLLKNKKQKN
jgi:hypothetical protein